jgi:hypothetical protein
MTRTFLSPGSLVHQACPLRFPLAVVAGQGVITNLESEIALLKTANKGLVAKQERVEGQEAAHKRREQQVRQGWEHVHR